uniref:Melatonin-related receptor-like n=1 Tax=Saccoglossus kowalevskii TaxID=10224 RepID=A0ABM0MX97_SACKO|nr:PREDICTED: melatonin-related receptor-like [Saccoglossus kowalevskii]
MYHNLNATVWKALQDREDGTKIFESAAMAFIMVQGIVGNCLVITVTCCNSKLHTIANYLILNLAVSDMLMVCIDMPISLYALTVSDWTFGLVVCYFHSFTIFWFGIVCLFTLAIISLNRYYYICKFSNYSKIFNHNTVKVIIGIVWFVSAVISAMCLVPQWSNVEYSPGHSSCMPNFKSSSVIFCIILLVVAILIPNCTYACLLSTHLSHSSQEQEECE